MQHPLQITARRDPAYPQARGQGLGERAAQQHPTVIVERLDGPRARVGVGQLTVDIVFDNGHVKALGQGHQGPFARLGHDVAQRIVATGGDLDCLDRPLLQRQLQRIQADAGQRVGGYLQRLHAQPFEGLHGAVKARRIDRHNISRLTHRPNTA